jgi:hypothetical protein
MTKKISIEVCRDGWTKGLQLNIDNGSDGYRLAGPKFNGSSMTLLKTELDERDAREIREYLDQGFPLTENETRAAALQEAVSAVVHLMVPLPGSHPDKSGLQAALKLLHELRGEARKGAAEEQQAPHCLCAESTAHQYGCPQFNG